MHALRTSAAMLAAVLLPISVSSAHAQSALPTAWLGVAPPPPLTLPPQLGVLEDGRFAAPAATVPPGEAGDVELEGERVLGWLEQIVGFSRQSRASGELMWGRISGISGAAPTAAWMGERFREAGLADVRVERYEADAGTTMWWPDHWEVRLLGDAALGDGTGDIVLASAVPVRGAEIPTGSVTAPLVFAGDAGAFLDVDVRGKVAVQRVKPASGAFGQRDAISEGSQELVRRGAIGVLNYIDQPGNMHVRDFSGCGQCFNVGGADGAFLRQISERATQAGKLDHLRVRLFLAARDRPNLSAHNVVGMIAGDSDEVVIVNAHLDGWYDAAGDNGDGLAVQVALARHFARPENRPARTLVFVASGGHHSTGLNGPSHFVQMNRSLADRAVLVLNLEHIAQFEVSPQTFELQRAEQPMGWGVTNMAPALLALTDRARDRYGFRLRPQYSTSVAGDLGGYASLGIPRVQAIHAGPLYHTSGDVLHSISVEGLERSARFYAHWIDAVARMARSEIDP
jgi:hypothetical protein